ncbi:MAG: MarR family winged helix-turn-helix transcriptional regulator [Eubacteriales bacterium]|nr:MarR family winged helix-turn-helix transcriptional regulator [Eubacteriales bacterium]
MDVTLINLLAKYAKEYGHAKIRQAGVTDTEHTICTFLYFHSGTCQDMLANTLMLDKTTVAKALFSLETRGLILRLQDPNNRRKNILSITPDGKAAIGQTIGIYDEWLARIMEVLSPKEQQDFEQYCDRLLAEAKKINEEKQS